MIAEGDAATVVFDASAGAAFLVLGAVTLGWSGSRRFAIVSALGGLAWFTANASAPLVLAYRPLMVHAALSYPSGRLRGRIAYGTVAFAWLGVVVVPVGRNAVTTLALAIGLVVAASARVMADRLGPQRPAAIVSLQAAVPLALALSGPGVVRLFVPVSSMADAVTIGQAALVTLTAVVLLVAVVMRVGGAADTADAVVELAEMRAPEVEAMLVARGERAVRDQRSDDPAIAAVLDTAAGLLAANAQLHADLQAQVDQVRRSRRRQVEVADVESRRLERRLVEGAGEQIDSLDDVLAELAEFADKDAQLLIGRVTGEIEALRDDLARLGRGLHPRPLVEGGLRAALVDLALRAAVPTSIVVPDGRFPAMVETTLWYVCAEAVANAGKHSRARTMQITVVPDGNEVVATVIDDGAGGARLAAGRGLTGLADRLDAVGGRLELGDGPEGGTRLQARVPVA